MQPKYTPEDIERFWGKVNKTSDETDCWIWNAYRNPSGYGQFGWLGKVRLAHRISYEISFGDFDNDLYVLHRCDNPSCVNPNHLFLGTQDDNIQDMIKKGRAAKPEIRRGERSRHHKLTDKQVSEILEKHATGNFWQRELADMYGVHQTQISHIVNRKQRT